MVGGYAKLVGEDTPITCHACKKVIPDDSPGNVRPFPSGLLKLFCDECVTHTHKWTEDSSRRTRLHGDVYEDPVKCECGATAWLYNWCGKRNITGLEYP